MTGTDLALGMPATHKPLTSILRLQMGMFSKQSRNLRFHGLRQKLACPGAQDFRQRVIGFPWLAQIHNCIVCYGVSLLHWRCGKALNTSTIRHPLLNPSPSFGHSSS